MRYISKFSNSFQSLRNVFKYSLNVFLSRSFETIFSIIKPISFSRNRYFRSISAGSIYCNMLFSNSPKFGFIV
ncbi:MAG: hypothetical protein WCG25_02850 [bacterium]